MYYCENILPLSYFNKATILFSEKDKDTVLFVFGMFFQKTKSERSSGCKCNSLLSLQYLYFILNCFFFVWKIYFMSNFKVFKTISYAFSSYLSKCCCYKKITTHYIFRNSIIILTLALFCVFPIVTVIRTLEAMFMFRFSILCVHLFFL